MTAESDELLAMIVDATQREREALRVAIREGLSLVSPTLDHSGFRALVYVQGERIAQDQVEATKFSEMLLAANQYLDPLRDRDQGLDTQEARAYVDSLGQNVLARFLRAVIDLEEKTLTVADPPLARIQLVLVGQELLVELSDSRRLPPSET
ncbi:MAG: hypothetical protein HYS86_04220 [Candidatus Chisholmbacteria bacterium]|nr:hypothetical protein [Candidatus Chisholmbacteria bacterium]